MKLHEELIVYTKSSQLVIRELVQKRDSYPKDGVLIVLRPFMLARPYADAPHDLFHGAVAVEEFGSIITALRAFKMIDQEINDLANRQHG